LSYLYEIHLHTAPASDCAVSPGAEYIQAYIDQGYTGIFVTDHFFNGNTGIPRKLPWREWVKRFYQGYEETKNEGDRRGLDVFFGWEETFDLCDDYLIFGMDRDWLFDHPEARNWTRGEQYRTVKAAGGTVVQAHPFRERNYIKRIVLSTGCVDAVEAANGGNASACFDALALCYAKRLGLPVLAGSDIHDAKIARNGKVFGTYLDTKLESPADIVKAIQNNRISGLKMPPGRCDYQGNETITLPLEVRDEYDRVIHHGGNSVLAYEEIMKFF